MSHQRPRCRHVALRHSLWHSYARTSAVSATGAGQHSCAGAKSARPARSAAERRRSQDTSPLKSSITCEKTGRGTCSTTQIVLSSKPTFSSVNKISRQKVSEETDFCDKSAVRPETATGLGKLRTSMPSKLPAYTTKELTKRTWRDFEKLFSQGNGWDHCQCTHFQRPCPLPKEQWLRSRAERSVRNRWEKRKLVDHGRAHGILVYTNGEPVGWCQYGRAEELPRIDNSRNYRALAPQQGSIHLWRITCFVVDRKHRRRGVASLALQATLESIKKKGGGLVEAYPLINWDTLCRSEMRRRGHVPSFGNMSTHGTVSMFEKQGFEMVAPFGNSNVLMRRTV